MRSFVVEVRAPDLIRHARTLLSCSDSDAPHIGGIIVKTAAAYNVGWSYHLTPASVFFFDVAAEVGDSTVR